MSDDELINIALDYADENDNFNPHFIKSLEEALEEYDELTDAQRAGLENIVKQWDMI
jgi:hypothetical protein